MVAAGRMDRRIVIQAVTETRDSMGGPVQSWSTFATVWAERKDLTGREYFAAGQSERAEIESVWRIRHLSGLTNKHRFTHGGETYDIESIATIGRDEAMELRAVKAAS